MGKPKCEEISKITQVLDIKELIEINSNYSIIDGNLFKDRNRYFGNITVQVNSGYFTNSGDVIGSFAKKILNHVNTGCFLSDSQWATRVVGYCYMATDSIIIASNAANTYKYAKLDFDVITTD